MLFNVLYLLCFFALGALSLYSIVAGWRRPAARPTVRPTARPHPELLDRHGRVIREPLLVVRVTPREVDIRDRLEALYNQSPDSDERQER